jgi:hypothetical protein
MKKFGSHARYVFVLLLILAGLGLAGPAAGLEYDCIPLPADFRGKIAVVDPRWKFVVINVGEEQGALPDCELLVSRGGVLVAKVKISRVEKDRCIANIMPGWKFGDVLEGDVVIPAIRTS